MKKKVLKWNLTLFNTETQQNDSSVDYEYHEYKIALRDMLAARRQLNTDIYIIRLKKKVRIVEVEAPGTMQFKKLIALSGTIFRRVME